MRNVWMWFYLSCKRYLRRVSFLVILLLLPAAAFFIRQAETKEGTEIRIAVASEAADGSCEDQDRPPLEKELIDALTGRGAADHPGMFRFYECGSEEEVKKEVASRRAECGYVILKGLRGRLEGNDYKRCIRIYTAPSTVAAKLSSETVFAELIRIYDRELFSSYAAEAEIFDEAEQTGAGREVIQKQADELYQKWKENGSTFHFVYESVSGPDADEKIDREGGSADGTALFPVRGIAAVYIFAAGLYSAAVSLSDERRGLFLAVPYHIRGVCQIMAMAAPIVLAAVSGLAALCSGHAFRADRGAWEIFVMGGYIAAVAVFSWLVRLVCKREEVIYCLLPVCLIGSLIFCPVFVDAARYLPGLGWVGRLFLPWYYLNFLN